MAKILYAEDDRSISDLVAFKLTHAGHEVSQAFDGVEALALVSSERPDLVLLDVMMPVLSGFEVLQKMKEDPRLEPIPVIMLSAKSHESDVLMGLTGGADDYITKPFNMKEVAARVERILTRPMAKRDDG